PDLADGEVVQTKVCLYDMTENSDFVIDKDPERTNVVYGYGFSGHGFKFAPLIGKLLAELTQDEKPGFNLERFSILPARRRTPATVDPSSAASLPTYNGRTRASLTTQTTWIRAVTPRITDSAIRTAPVESRMALPRLPMLHFPGVYSGVIPDQFLQIVTSFIWAPLYIDWQRWREPPPLPRKRTNSPQ